MENSTSQSSNVLDAENQKMICNICLDEADNPVSTICNHLFCKVCLGLWLSKEFYSDTKTTCPVCRNFLGSMAKIKAINCRGCGKPRNQVMMMYRNNSGTQKFDGLKNKGWRFKELYKLKQKRLIKQIGYERREGEILNRYHIAYSEGIYWFRPRQCSLFSEG